MCKWIVVRKKIVGLPNFFLQFTFNWNSLYVNYYYYQAYMNFKLRASLEKICIATKKCFIQSNRGKCFFTGYIYLLESSKLNMIYSILLKFAHFFSDSIIANQRMQAMIDSFYLKAMLLLSYMRLMR